MTEEEREDLRRRGASERLIVLCESEAADDADDDDTSWQWLTLLEFPKEDLLFLKHSEGAEFVRKIGMKTRLADEAFGDGWLDDPNI